MSRSGNGDPYNLYANNVGEGMTPRIRAIAARADTLTSAFARAGQLGAIRPEAVIVVDGVVQGLMGCRPTTSIIPAWPIYEADIEVDSVVVHGKPATIHVGFALDRQGRVLQFISSDRDKVDNGQRHILVTLCEPLPADPASDALFVTADSACLRDPDMPYETYNQSGAEQLIRDCLDDLGRI